MRLSRIILMCSALLIVPLAPEAVAQRQGAVVRQVQTAGPARFRARAATDRLATARGLMGMNITISDEFLNAPFSLTPRQPSINGRGWIEAQGPSQFLARIPSQSAGEPWAGPDGAITFYGGMNTQVTLHLEQAAGKRFLVDCVAHGTPRIEARAGAISVEANVVTGGLISIVTPMGVDEILIDSIGGPSWRLTGCEITRVQ
jgi:hypothetical protein